MAGKDLIHNFNLTGISKVRKLLLVRDASLKVLRAKCCVLYNQPRIFGFQVRNASRVEADTIDHVFVSRKIDSALDLELQNDGLKHVVNSCHDFFHH